jgi:phage terminase Nu1 subunit (DNA packaging protein)
MLAPPWVDAPTLARLICCSVDTVDNWAAQGIIPPPMRRGGKRLWRWAEVDKWLTNGGTDLRPGSITDAVRKAVNAH